MANDNPLFNLTSFLFGNVDDNGDLVDDILDEDCKKHIHTLGKLGLQPLLTEIIGEDSIKNEHDVDTNYDSFDDFGLDIKSPSAIDYSEENEMASEPLPSETPQESIVKELSNDLDEGTCNGSMPPPLVPVSYPRPSTPTNDEDGGKRKLETPLAAMLPEKYANVDVREFFPDFRFGKVVIDT